MRISDWSSDVCSSDLFGKPIGQFQALQHYVADIATMQTTTELLVNYAAWKMTTGQDCGLESNMVKLVASENANKAADLGIQILGGMGYSAETVMQSYWRDSRLWRVGPITHEMEQRRARGGEREEPYVK